MVFTPTHLETESTNNVYIEKSVFFKIDFWKVREMLKNTNFLKNEKNVQQCQDAVLNKNSLK